MGWIKAIQGFFGALNAWFRASERNENERAGINKMKVAQNDKRDEVRKDADNVWDRDDRDRLQRTPTKGKGRK